VLAAAADLQRHTRELQDRVMSVRMVPLATVFSQFPRLAHDLGEASGKKVTLDISGGDTELDKAVVERLADPLTHLVRNAIDHGLEDSADRLTLGKTEDGRVTLAASHVGGAVVVQVTDDGRGLDYDRIREKAKALGWLGPDAAASDEQLAAFLFQPGFSTAKTVTDVSGRGVGMDVVKRNIEALGGKVAISTERGRGTSFRITLPLTLAILDGQLLGIAEQVFVVPLVTIAESLRPAISDVRTVLGHGEVVIVRGEALPLLRLHDALGISGAETDPTRGIVVIAESDGKRYGLLVDHLLGQQQVVIKSLETNYRKVDGVSAATILGDGRVALILDVGGLTRKQ
jgi:two-component system chemotaxis sensor kinase CheA